MSELSPWFNMNKPDERPVRNGIYEVEYWNGCREKRDWRDGYWMSRNNNGEAIHFPSAYIKQWRGVV